MNHKRLYVGDLAPTVSEGDLKTLFAEVGGVEAIDLSPGRNSANGFAFVEMTNPESAREAIKRFNGFDLAGFRLIVYAVPPRSRPREAATR
jgi:RNA recognition motif-containing protein